MNAVVHAPPADGRAVAAALQDALSERRLRLYRTAADVRLPDALSLYRWNTTVEAAMFEILGMVEGTVRNALDVELAAACPGGRWWESA